MRKDILIVFFVLITLTVSFSTNLFAESKKSLVKVSNLSQEEIDNLANRGFDICHVGRDGVDIVVEQNQIQTLFPTKPVKILIHDLDRYVGGILKNQSGEAKYFTYQTMTETLKEFAKNYPQICRLESIGKSCENRDIWALKISDNPQVDEKEPAVLFMGAHHAREWITFEVPMAAIKTLLENYNINPQISKLVNEREIWFVPMVNPDGVIYSQTQSKFWRKNRRKNPDGSFGVDPNRNYGYKWGTSGTSTYPNSDTYCGPKPFSEPETQAIRDLAEREKFCGSISFHSYGEEILYPWSYAKNVPCEHREIFVKMASDMARFNKYDPIESCDLYPSSGDTDDYLYGEKKSLSFTFELARTFIPDPREISKICEINMPCVLYLIEKAGTYGLVTPSGEEVIESLTLEDTLNAINDLVKVANNATVLDRIDKLQKLAAKKMYEELRKGDLSTINLLHKMAKTNSAFEKVIKLVQNMTNFEKFHEKRPFKH